MSVTISGAPVTPGFKLAPDAGFPDGSGPRETGLTVNVNAATYVTLLELSGRWVVSLLDVANIQTGSTDIRLTIDGQVVWDRNFDMATTRLELIGSDFAVPEPFIVENGFKLELRHVTDSQVSVLYVARPIL